MTKQRKTSQAQTNNGGATKIGKLEAMLRRPAGATIPQLVKALDWQAHSVRGAMSGTLKKKGLKISAGKEDGHDRVYRIAE
jgi:hypothetical protein